MRNSRVRLRMRVLVCVWTLSFALVLQASDIIQPSSGVVSFNTRTGAVTLTAGDVTGAGGVIGAANLTNVGFIPYVGSSGSLSIDSTYALKVNPAANISPASTVFIQDSTASSGDTALIIRDGANQTGPEVLIEDVNGNVRTQIGNASGLILDNGSANVVYQAEFANVPLGYVIGFSPSTNAAGVAADLGISRIGAGILGIGNGSNGNLSGTIKAGNANVATYSSATNCASGASPAVCGSAIAGSVAIPAGTNPTLVVNTSAVTAASQIFFQIDDTVGTRLSVTCNSTLANLVVPPAVTARSAGTSFTLSYSGVITANPLCVSYWIIN
jgi:hypothetical protein